MNSFEFSLKNLVQLLRPDLTATTFDSHCFTKEKKDCSVVELISKYPGFAKDWGFLLEQRFMLLRKVSMKKHTLELLLDCRFDQRITDISTRPIYHLVVSHENRFWKCCFEDENKKPLYLPNSKSYKSLGHILNLNNNPNKIADPSNIQELREYFHKHLQPPLDVQIRILVVATNLTKHPTYIFDESFGSSTAQHNLVVEARPGKTYKWAFRNLNPTDKQQKGTNKQNTKGLNNTLSTLPRNKTFQSDSFWSVNRSCGMKIFRKGLNLAFDLGLITDSNLTILSHQMASTAACLICQHDEMGHLRQLTYFDNVNTTPTFFSIELDCMSTETNAILHFFQQIEAQREILCTKRKMMLAQVTSKLNTISKGKDSGYSHCKEHLEMMIQRQILITYCPTDLAMHNLKFIFGKHVLNTSKNNLCRVQLKTNAQNDIIAMVTAKFCLMNVAGYVDINKDLQLCNIINRPTIIQHSWRNIQHCNPSIVETLFCLNQTIGIETLNLWQNLNKHFMELFSYDIYPVTYQSLPQLSWMAIHSKSARNKGPLGQATEKLKPAYNNLLRQYARGGFMFSARNQFVSNQIIGHNTSSDTEYRADCIKEFDISSSYAYAGASSLLPGGFTVAYIQNVHANSQMTTDTSDKLLRADTKRWKSFEFRAVYYTLRKLQKWTEQSNNRDNLHIHTVYSNFAPLGVFQISKCILDLAVILNNGSLLLYNFDSNFSHACDRCPLLPKYIGNQTHFDLRMKSFHRDKVINDWIHQCGLCTPVNYTVFTDCHDEEYSAKNLADAFKSDPMLAALQQDCPLAKVTDTKGILRWIKNNSNNRHFTYLAVTRGKANSNQTPLIIQGCQKSKGGHRLTNATEQQIPILLSRDYLEYLFQQHNFEVEIFEAVLFFGVDQHTSKLYDALMHKRHSTHNSILADLLKKIINLSVGFYAINEHKTGKPQYILTNQFPQKASFKTHSIMDMYGVKEWGDNEDPMFVYQRNVPTKRYANNTLHLHLAIIEFAKLRLVSFINFLQEYLALGSFTITYANTDNVQIIFASSDLCQLVTPKEKQIEFVQKWTSFVALEKKKGGYFKEEWSTNSEFTYVTAYVQNYAVVSDNVKFSRWAGVNRLSHSDVLEMSVNLLKHSTVTVTQERRIDKIKHCDTVNKEIQFKPDLTRPTI